MPVFCVDGAALAPCPAPGTPRSLNTLGSVKLKRVIGQIVSTEMILTADPCSIFWRDKKQ